MQPEGKIRALFLGRGVKEVHPTNRAEPRWPVALAIIAVLSLFSLMPERSRIPPSWSGFAIGLALILLMVGVWLGGDRRHWLRIERWAMLALASALLCMTLLGVIPLVMEIMKQTSQFGGLQLLTVGIEAWVTNIVAFSIVYWYLDRGGPENRARQSATLPDWLFPQAGLVDEVAPGHHQQFRPGGQARRPRRSEGEARVRPRLRRFCFLLNLAASLSSAIETSNASGSKSPPIHSSRSSRSG